MTTCDSHHTSLQQEKATTTTTRKQHGARSVFLTLRCCFLIAAHYGMSQLIQFTDGVFFCMMQCSSFLSRYSSCDSVSSTNHQLYSQMAAASVPVVAVPTPVAPAKWVHQHFHGRVPGTTYRFCKKCWEGTPLPTDGEVQAVLASGKLPPDFWPGVVGNKGGPTSMQNQLHQLAPRDCARGVPPTSHEGTRI